MQFGLAREGAVGETELRLVPPTAAKAYRQNQVAGAGPLHLVLMAYDAALSACAKGDLERLTRAVDLLRSALDCEARPELAGSLLALYHYSMDLARQGNYEAAMEVLRELKAAWAHCGPASKGIRKEV